MKNSVTNKIFERWKQGDRFHLLVGNNSDNQNIFIGSYVDCLQEVCDRYGFEELPADFLLIDVTDDLIEQITNFVLQPNQGGSLNG